MREVGTDLPQASKPVCKLTDHIVDVLNVALTKDLGTENPNLCAGALASIRCAGALSISFNRVHLAIGILTQLLHIDISPFFQNIYIHIQCQMYITYEIFF